MKLTISNEITIANPTPEVTSWCKEHLTIPNPEYLKKQRMGMWLGKTPREIVLYRKDGNALVIPTGCGKEISHLVNGTEWEAHLADNGLLDGKTAIPLYDYQKDAVGEMLKYDSGILQSPCGSGKTQMGIALAAEINRKTLWITHTHDLLNQSYERAAGYFPKEQLGKIASGKVEIGSRMTFATVQTLSKMDLEKYRYEWDVIIVDECHRVSGTPGAVTMFYKVLSNLAARKKYGLSATVHRSDGLIRCAFACIGPVIYIVPESAVADKTMRVRILRRDTGRKISRQCLDTDGTLIYSVLIDYLTTDRVRNQMIISDLAANKDRSNLILSDRLQHLAALMDAMPMELRHMCAMIDGKMTSKKGREERECAIEGMRSGKIRYLFASFSLAKEGLDIPRLDRLYMTVPKKDYAVVTQSIGRIARTFEGKTDAVCYDYVDNIPFCENQFKKRMTSYRKAGCIL